MMDLITIGAGIALVAGHVLGEALRGWSSGRASRVFFVALAVAAVSYVLLGAWTLWPVPVFAGLLFGTVQGVHARRLETARSWSTLQIGALATIAAFAFFALPLLFLVGAVQRSEPVWHTSFFAAIAAVTGLIATVGLGGAFMNVAIRPFAVKMRGAEVVEEGGRVIEPLENGFENAGRVIGHYERLLIFLFVLADAAIAIGFLVAAKSVFRFGDLTDGTNRKKAEYLLIGTLMSFAYALTVSYATRFILHFLMGG